MKKPIFLTYENISIPHNVENSYVVDDNGIEMFVLNEIKRSSLSTEDDQHSIDFIEFDNDITITHDHKGYITVQSQTKTELLQEYYDLICCCDNTYFIEFKEAIEEELGCKRLTYGELFSIINECYPYIPENTPLFLDLDGDITTNYDDNGEIPDWVTRDVVEYSNDFKLLSLKDDDEDTTLYLLLPDEEEFD